MYACYNSLSNCSEDEDVFGDASHEKARTKHGRSGETGELQPAQEKQENSDLSVCLTADT